MVFTALAVALVISLAVLIALLLNEPFPGRGFVRAMVLVPWAIPPVVNGLMWQWIYDAKVGALNGLLVAAGVLPAYRGWLSNPTDALLALVTAHVWNAVPLGVILLLAALQTIPGELYDAGRVDGSSAGQLFRHVTLPWLAQPLLVVLVLQTMLAIRVFDVIYVLTAGGPGTSTTTLVWLAYLTTFDSLDFGLGNAYAYTISLITLGLALVYFRVLYGRGEFEA
jgi:multiple sugar transport system permease protein